ncbi:MAG: hypothetical protein JWR60_513 [Polaromonas sp.]|nr:hypothetical protein [Polaromonas sp.]
MANFFAFRSVLTMSIALAATAAQAQSCEGGAYLNPQLFSGEAASQHALAEQEMRAFMATTGLSTTPLYSIKHVDEVTSSSRAPYCWIYSNQVMGLMSGYKPVVVNSEAGQPSVLAITGAVAGGPKDPGAVALKSLTEADQLAVLDQLRRSKCLGTSGGVETEIVKAEGLCAIVVNVPPQSTVGQQGVIAKAVYEWDDQTWAGVATRAGSALKASVKGMAGRSENVHTARLVVVPTKGTSVGFGLYAHPSVPAANLKKAASVFQALSSPSKPLAVALDLGPRFSFVEPSAAQLEKMGAAIGFRK